MSIIGGDESELAILKTSFERQAGILQELTATLTAASWPTPTGRGRAPSGFEPRGERSTSASLADWSRLCSTPGPRSAAPATTHPSRRLTPARSPGGSRGARWTPRRALRLPDSADHWSVEPSLSVREHRHRTIRVERSTARGAAGGNHAGPYQGVSLRQRPDLANRESPASYGCGPRFNSSTAVTSTRPRWQSSSSTR